MICTKLIEAFIRAIAAQKATCNHNFQFSILNFQFVAAALLVLLSSCSGNGDEVSIEGRLLHMNQATFYVYSTDGTIEGIDTIRVNGGRFEYDREISREGTLVIVFPNYSQMPVFVEPGASISIKGDAAHLREAEVKGTSLNKAFTDFRKEHINATQKELKSITADAVKEKRYGDDILLWLIQQYYLTPDNADAKGAAALLKTITQADPDNLKAKRLLNQLTATGTLAVGDRVEHFEATDISGNAITDKALQQGTCAVVTVTSWSHESQAMLRRLATKQRDGELLRVVAICIDADKKAAERIKGSCNADNATMICDGMQWDSPLLRVFALNNVPDNVVTENGKVTRHSVAMKDL